MLYKIRARIADRERKDSERDQKKPQRNDWKWSAKLQRNRRRNDWKWKAKSQRNVRKWNEKRKRIGWIRNERWPRRWIEKYPRWRESWPRYGEREQVMTTLIRTEKKFDKARLKSEAQRIEIMPIITRLPDDQHIQIVQHYRRAQSGSKPIIIMSTHSIAQENTETLVRIHVSLQGSERPDRGSSKGPSLDSNALDLSSPASSGGEANVGNRKGFSTRTAPHPPSLILPPSLSLPPSSSLPPYCFLSLSLSAFVSVPLCLCLFLISLHFFFLPASRPPCFPASLSPLHKLWGPGCLLDAILESLQGWCAAGENCDSQSALRQKNWGLSWPSGPRVLQPPPVAIGGN